MKVTERLYSGTTEVVTEAVTLRFINAAAAPYCVEVMLRSGHTLPLTRQEWNELRVLAAREDPR